MWLGRASCECPLRIGKGRLFQRTAGRAWGTWKVPTTGLDFVPWRFLPCWLNRDSPVWMTKSILARLAAQLNSLAAAFWRLLICKWCDPTLYTPRYHMNLMFSFSFTEVSLPVLLHHCKEHDALAYTAIYEYAMSKDIRDVAPRAKPQRNLQKCNLYCSTCGHTDSC